jgi:hypothetical protein
MNTKVESNGLGWKEVGGICRVGAISRNNKPESDNTVCERLRDSMNYWTLWGRDGFGRDSGLASASGNEVAKKAKRGSGF